MGCRVLSSSVCMDKIFTKKLLDRAGIPQVKSVYVKKRYDGGLVAVTDEFDEVQDVEEYIVNQLGLPCFIKASRSGSSVGCYRCDNREDILPKIQQAAQYDSHIVDKNVSTVSSWRQQCLEMMISSCLR